MEIEICDENGGEGHNPNGVWWKRRIITCTLFLLIVGFSAVQPLMGIIRREEGQTHLLKGVGAVEPVANSSVCFIHVGKSGGNSITQALDTMMKRDDIEDFIQIHTHKRKFRHRNIDSFGKHFWNRKRHNYYQFPGPMSIYASNGYKPCSTTSQVLLWVRDPVSRLISTWNFKERHSMPTVHDAIWEKNFEGVVDEGYADLNLLIEYAAKSSNLSKAREDFRDILQNVHHANGDIRSYLGDENGPGCDDALDGLPIIFAGRTERFMEDWETFLDLVVEEGGYRPTIPHTHSTDKKGRQLSATSVSYLKDYYKGDYECIEGMVQRNYLDPGYWDLINDPEKVYAY